MELTVLRCPGCDHTELKEEKSYLTLANGLRWLWRCLKCGKCFSETKNTLMEGLRTSISVIARVFKDRTQGMGLNATAENNDVSKNTILDWEQRLSSLKATLLVYALTHEFLQQFIEGDEVYTKVRSNVSQEESQGWTVILMDRASRFIWAMKCGKKQRQLFQAAIQTLCWVVKQTQDLTLITDGERRYGNLLFEVCQELVRTGKRGRPRITLRKGVKVRLKNKGSQAHKRGRKRPKYEAPQAEHPETTQDMTTSQIHANHLEAQNAALRRRNSAYRRRTNTYAKRTDTLQRTLDVHWIMHNFVKVHFTTGDVPAVKLGILKEGFSWEDLFKIQRREYRMSQIEQGMAVKN